MNEELNLELVEKYPEMFLFHNFRGRGHFVFECGDGWYNILDHLFANIKAHVKNNNERFWKLDEAETMIDNGCRADVPIYLQNRIEELRNGNGVYPVEMGYPEFQQIKEKFGTARIYHSSGLTGDDYIDGLIAMAESMSETTCEECGNVGKTGNHGGNWIKTLCDEHSAARALALANNQARQDAAKWSEG